MTVDKLLHDFLTKGVKFYPATNSLKFHSNDEADENYLWIDPPWRIVKGNRVIASSFTCPWHENFKTKEEYQHAFTEWCQAMNYLNELEVKGHLVRQPVNDLVIEWSDGTILEVFQKRYEDDSWYITDKSNKKYYLALPDKIQITDMK
ncbi:MAG: hypothetical protein U0U09_19170 [Cyclobacteriaceae bacterium]